MKTITLTSEKHRNKKVILIQFGYDDEVKNHLKNYQIFFGVAH